PQDLRLHARALRAQRAGGPAHHLRGAPPAQRARRGRRSRRPRRPRRGGGHGRTSPFLRRHRAGEGRPARPHPDRHRDHRPGRPSMGKTAFAMNIAKYAGVRSQRRVLVLSLEMSKEQLVQRLLCAEGRVDSHKVRTGYLDTRDWTSLTNAAGRLAEAPIYIDDSPALSVLEARAKARRMKAEHGLHLI